MESSLNQKQAKWWCIHFGQESIDLIAAKKLQFFFKKITPHVVFGHQKVFLDVSRSNWKKSLYSFQLRLAEVAKKMKLNPDLWQWGVGKGMAEAWVMARWKTLSIDLLPLEAVFDFLNPLGLDENAPNDRHRLRSLRSVGANTLQDLVEVPEDVLLTHCGFWITDFTREHFSRPEAQRENWLEKTTSESLFQSISQNNRFELEDWIPDEYLQVA